jgi:hypothetical protein
METSVAATKDKMDEIAAKLKTDVVDGIEQVKTTAKEFAQGANSILNNILLGTVTIVDRRSSIPIRIRNSNSN